MIEFMIKFPCYKLTMKCIKDDLLINEGFHIFDSL